MGTRHTFDLLRTEVRWLFRGKLLTLSAKLHQKLKFSWKEKLNILKKHLLDEECNLTINYWANIFSKLKEAYVVKKLNRDWQV